jgi:hypothetical protein
MGRVHHRSTLMARAFDRVASLVSSRGPLTPYGYDFSSHDLHVDGDLVCPRCLGWIQPQDFVRRTAYGPAQHEVCPRLPV